MSTKTRSKQRKPRAKTGQRWVLQKPNGVLHPRVQKVGPEHFGVVSVDVAKFRSKWMLCDFYGNVIIEPIHVEHGKSGFENAIQCLRRAVVVHELNDLVVSVERTGNYHEPVKRAFRDAGFETRIVHPFATKQFRQPANPGDKTDDHDLAAIHRIIRFVNQPTRVTKRMIMISRQFTGQPSMDSGLLSRSLMRSTDTCAFLFAIDATSSTNAQHSVARSESG